MGFQFYNSFYGYYPGIQIRGQIGKSFIYQISHGKQIRYHYVTPYNPRTDLQQANRNRIRQAVLSWKSLTEEQKNFYRRKEPINPTMSGYNYYIRQYIRSLK